MPQQVLLRSLDFLSDPLKSDLPHVFMVPIAKATIANIMDMHSKFR